MKKLLFILSILAISFTAGAQYTYLLDINVLHHKKTNYWIVGDARAIIDTTVVKHIASTTGDTVMYQVTDTVRVTKDTIGDSLIVDYNFPTPRAATLDFQYIAGDTLTDTVQVYGNYKLLYTYTMPAGNSGKGGHDIYFTFNPAFVTGNSSLERFTFLTRKKKKAKTATTNKWLFNYIYQ